MPGIFIRNAFMPLEDVMKFLGKKGRARRLEVESPDAFVLEYRKPDAGWVRVRFDKDFNIREEMRIDV